MAENRQNLPLAFKSKLLYFALPFRSFRAVVGASPSGKAAVFGTAIRRFDPSRPSHLLHLRHTQREIAQ